MSNLENTIILENHFENALELTSAEMVTELGIELATPTPVLSKEAVIISDLVVPFEKHYSILTHDDLAEMVADKWMDEGPDGPC